MVNCSRKILFLSEVYHGSCHDYTMLKTEFNPEQGQWFREQELIVDLGFLGIQKDFTNTVKIPIKKPRKRELTLEEKDYNKSLSQVRIKVEHAIGGLKRFRLLSDRLRMRNMNRYNQITGLCAALWNFILIH